MRPTFESNWARVLPGLTQQWQGAWDIAKRANAGRSLTALTLQIAAHRGLVAYRMMPTRNGMLQTQYRTLK